MITPTPGPRANGESASAERPTFDRVSPEGDSEREAREPEQAPQGEMWVFGYGSLMWRPGFAYAFRCKAALRGWRRSLCIYSHVYRGTPEKPGLVLGLDRGGACAGVAFRVEASLREPTLRYLRDREQATSVYLERTVPVTLESGERVNALTYVADRCTSNTPGGSTARRCSQSSTPATASPATTPPMSPRRTTIWPRSASTTATWNGWRPGCVPSVPRRLEPAGCRLPAKVELRQARHQSRSRKSRSACSVKAFSVEPIVSPFALMTPERMDEAAGASESRIAGG